MSNPANSTLSPYPATKASVVQIDYWKFDEIVRSHYGVFYNYLEANPSVNDTSRVFRFELNEEGPIPVWKDPYAFYPETASSSDDFKVTEYTPQCEILEDLLNKGCFEGINEKQVLIIMKVSW